MTDQTMIKAIRSHTKERSCRCAANKSVKNDRNTGHARGQNSPANGGLFAPAKGQPFGALGASRAVLEVDGFGYQARR